MARRKRGPTLSNMPTLAKMDPSGESRSDYAPDQLAHSGVGADPNAVTKASKAPKLLTQSWLVSLSDGVSSLSFVSACWVSRMSIFWGTSSIWPGRCSTDCAAHRLLR